MPGIIIYPSATDVVGVFDTSFTQQFPNARPLVAEVREPKRFMDHPLEKGQIISDYAVILPQDIEIPFMVEPQFVRDTYQQIKNLFTNSTLLFVQTVTGLYANMVIAHLPHEESPQFYGSIRVPVKFRQVQIVQSTTQFATAAPADQNTQNSGVQNPVAVSGVNTSSGIATPNLTPPQNPLAQSFSGAISNIPSTINPNALTNPALPNSSYAISGVATVGGPPAITAGFQ